MMVGSLLDEPLAPAVPEVSATEGVAVAVAVASGATAVSEASPVLGVASAVAGAGASAGALVAPASGVEVAAVPAAGVAEVSDTPASATGKGLAEASAALSLVDEPDVATGDVSWPAAAAGALTDDAVGSDTASLSVGALAPTGSGLGAKAATPESSAGAGDWLLADEVSVPSPAPTVPAASLGAPCSAVFPAELPNPVVSAGALAPSCPALESGVASWAKESAGLGSVAASVVGFVGDVWSVTGCSKGGWEKKTVSHSWNRMHLC